MQPLLLTAAFVTVAAQIEGVARFSTVASVNGARLSILEDPALDDATTAGSIWPAGRMLAEHLAEFVDVQDKLVLELGSGTGVLGLAAAASGARRVLLTDIHMATAQRNAVAASGVPAGVVMTHLLRWGEPTDAARALQVLGGTPDIVLGGDIVYRGFDLSALLATLRLLASGTPATSGKRPLIVLSFKNRTGGNAETAAEFELGMTRRGFHWEREWFSRGIVGQDASMWVYVASYDGSSIESNMASTERVEGVVELFGGNANGVCSGGNL